MERRLSTGSRLKTTGNAHHGPDTFLQMDLFFPDCSQDSEEIKAQWTEYLSRCSAPDSSRPVYRVLYYSNGSKVEARVGQPRLQYFLKRGPRGGHITNTEYSDTGIKSGNKVACTVDAGNCLYVFETETSDKWANPAMVGRDSILEKSYFDF